MNSRAKAFNWSGLIPPGEPFSKSVRPAARAISDPEAVGSQTEWWSVVSRLYLGPTGPGQSRVPVGHLLCLDEESELRDLTAKCLSIGTQNLPE